MTPTPRDVATLAAVDAACDRFEAAWRNAAGGAPPDLAAFVADLPPGAQARGRTELAAIDACYRGGPAVAPDAAATLSAAPASAESALRLRCPQCQGRVDLSADAPLDDITCQACGGTFGLLGDAAAVDAVAPRVGRFLLRQRIGVGGFGAVWRAHDPELDRDVALKLPRRGGLTPHEAEMFFREARSAAQLAHPGIVSVYEVGRDAAGSGSIYIVSELVDGVSLADSLKTWRPTHREAAAMVADVADALHYAHERGVVHRDLKPSNVMLDRCAPGGETARVGLAEVGRPRLLDFGLAKRDSGDLTLTIDGQVLGTPAYMSPEQASGQSRWIDRRTDVYSLGVVLFRMLTGELPFRGAAASQIQQRLIDDPPSPRRLDDRVPADLATVCLKCLERDPARRYATAAAVADEMRRFLAGEPVHARPLSPVGRAGRWAQRHPTLATALALGAVLAVGGPTATIVIARRNAELRRRYDEVLGLQADKAAAIDRVEGEKDLLRRAASRSGTAATLPRWRLELVERFLAAHYDDADEPPTKPEARLAFARLLVAVGRADEAQTLLRAVAAPAPSAVATGVGEAVAEVERPAGPRAATPAGVAGSIAKARALRDLVAPDAVRTEDLPAVADALLAPPPASDPRP